VENVIPTTTAPTEEIGFNPSFLADLAKMPGQRKNQPIFLQFNGATKPARVVWTDNNHDNVEYLYLLMPVRRAAS
jgi:DNA polymerase III sliding clamp (beta) subunit (PCNA family)